MGFQFIIAVCLVVSSFVAGWTVDDWKHSAVLSAQLQDQIAKTAREREIVDRISLSFEKKLANLKILNTTINNEVRHELEKTVYGDPNCDMPLSGVQLRNRAIDAANEAIGKPNAAVPTDSTDLRGKALGLRRFFPGGQSADRSVR